MRVFVLCLAALLMIGAVGCKQPQAQLRPYAYRSSAFSDTPGKVWSGNATAMLLDMEGVLERETIAARPLKNGLGFQKGRALLMQLRPLGPERENEPEVYALETIATDSLPPVRIHDAVADTLTRNHTAYAVVRP